MKQPLVVASAFALALAVGTSWSQTMGGPQHGKGNAAPPTASMAQMDEHMKKMQALHEKMVSATTPQERQKAAEEARKEMHAGMEMMQPMMHGGAKSGAGHKHAPDTARQLQMMNKRMDMMQMMMQSMMDQQGMTSPPPTVPKP